jgi:hypothetical protein
MDLVDQLGSGALAKRLGQKHSTVCNWRSRGIPHRWRPAVAQIAAEKNLPIPEDFFDAPSPQPDDEVAA